MDRQIVYPGAIPLETDLLNTNKNAMIGLSKLAAAILGTSTFLNGLACTPTGPASLQVYVAPGEIYSLQNIDGTAYSSIAADTTHAILKQGISLDQLTLSCPAPVTAGQSVNYLIQVAYQDTDSGAVVLPYYNSSNPAQAYAGPANSGATQNTVRKGVCAVSAKAGVAATTGTQTTPAPDAGYIGAFVVTVAYGQTQITAPNISTYAGAPFLPSGGLVVGGLQGNACNISAAGGTADAITGSYTPGITALSNGMTLYVRAGSANATTTPTFTPNSGTIAAKTIVKGAGAVLAAGDIAGGGHWIELQYDLTLDKWVLLNPATGVAAAANLHGQCRLAKSGSNIVLSPFNGNKLVINGTAQTVPSAGVSLAATGLTVSTLYYIYAYMNAGVMTLEASTTGHSTDATTGVEIKTGDATRTLVGMARPITGPAFADTAAQRFVRSWFNDPGIQGINGLAIDRSTVSGTVVEIGASATERVEFLAWANERAKFEASGACTNTSGGNNGVFTSIGIDAISANANAFTWAGAGSGLSAGQYVFEPAACSVTAYLTEGYHYATLVGNAYSGGTAVWKAGSGINVLVG